MHTAICTFEDRAQAEQAVERLQRSGFDRSAIHLEHRHADGSPMGETQDALASVRARDRDREGLLEGTEFPGEGLIQEHEIALGSRLAESLGFFQRLFGLDHSSHADTYAGAVDRGLYVVMVEGRDEMEAERAQNALHGMEMGHFNMVHRAGQRPLRDVVAERQGASDIERSFGTARSDMGATHNEDVRIEGQFAPSESRQEGERAMASQGWGEQRRLDIVQEDRPIASPDLPLKDTDKPR